MSSVGTAILAWPGTLTGLVSRLPECLSMMKLLNLVYRLSPRAGQLVVDLWYRYMSRLDRQALMVFMNYGYAELDESAPAVALAAADRADRYCIQLYHHVATRVDLRGQHVLEVGCGRGGGSSYIARYLQPARLTGLDAAGGAIEFCRRHHDAPNLTFVHGQAGDLAFPDRSFDAVVNVESSHCYPSMVRFLSEVRRILRPGGHLLFADRRDRDEIDTLRRQFRDAGFEIVSEQQITANILRALDLDDERKQLLIRRHVPWFLRKAFRQFAATRGTSLYDSFRRGSWVYVSLVLRTAEAPA